MAGDKVIVTITVGSVLFLSILIYLNLSASPPILAEIPTLKDQPALFVTRPPTLQSDGEISFRDETFVRGITHRHAQKKDKLSSFEDTLGAGVCVLDVNNDGWDDLFFIAGSGNRRHFGGENWWLNPRPNQLYLNRGGIYFEDITEQSGINAIEFGLACAAADLNKDGWVDLVIANKGGNSIYQNLGGGKFTKKDAALAGDPKAFSTSILIKDFNGDELPDIIFGNYVNFIQEQNVLELNAGYQTQKSTNFDPSLYDAQADALFINQGNLEFTVNTTFTNENRHGRTLKFYEDEAILALNDKGSTSQIVYGPTKNPTLQKVVVNARDAATIETPGQTNKPLFIASDASKGGVYALELDNLGSNDKSWDYGINTEASLYLNSWAVLVADFNNDGAKDIFLTNGSISPHPDTEMTTVGQPSSLLLSNSRQKRFDKFEVNSSRILSGRGAAYLDFNQDGSLDVIINNNNDYAALLINTHKHEHWLGLKCVPTYLCETAEITQNGNLHAQPFKAQQHYMSQSTTGLLLDTGAPQETKIQINYRGATLEKTLTEYNQYYLINLASNTIEPIKKQVQPTTTDNLAIREEFISHIKHNIYTPRTLELTTQLMTAEKEDKLAVIKAIDQAANHQYFPLIDFWALDKDAEIALPAIDTLKHFEAEEAIPRLLSLLNSPNEAINCAASNAFEFFFWKDEAVIERKKWAIAPLVKLLDNSNTKIRICAMNALAQSESFRALVPLLGQLESTDDWLVSNAVHALGMLRQTLAIAPLQKQLVTHPSPIVRAQTLVALLRLNVTVTDEMAYQLFRQDKTASAVAFNGVLALTLEKLDDGVVSTKIKGLMGRNPLPENYSFLENLSLEELHTFYLQNADLKIPAGNKHYLTIAQFNLLLNYVTEPARIAELFLKLSATDKLIALKTLPASVLAQKAIAGTPTLLDLCTSTEDVAEPNSLCGKFSKIAALPMLDMAEQIKTMLNSGQYETVYSLGKMLIHTPRFPLALNQLLADPTLADSDKLKLACQLPLNTTTLSFIAEFFPRLNPADQTALLAVMEEQLPANLLQPWLHGIPAEKLAQSTHFHILGILPARQEGG